MKAPPRSLARPARAPSRSRRTSGRSLDRPAEGAASEGLDAPTWDRGPVMHPPGSSRRGRIAWGAEGSSTPSAPPVRERHAGSVAASLAVLSGLPVLAVLAHVATPRVLRLPFPHHAGAVRSRLAEH